MERISNAIRLPFIPQEIQAQIDRNTELSYEQRQQEECDRMNATPGNFTGYSCPDCLNRGGSYIMSDGYQVFKQCHCMEIRKSINRIERSGLAQMLDRCTFESFQTPEAWQRHMKECAQRCAVDCTNGKWFYAGGQVGSGKTHLCTAIVGELLHSGKSARYMLWRDEVVQLKACVNDDVQYSKLINPLKSVDVLYIDDLFKTGAGKTPTAADISIAFELLNHRYINRQLVTILSSELSVDDLIDLDEAVGSRIYERTKEYCLYIPHDKSRNWRLKK